MLNRIRLVVDVLITIPFILSACGSYALVPQNPPSVETAAQPSPTVIDVSDGEEKPSIDIHPKSALADERVKIQVVGLAPSQAVTVRASMRDDLARPWTSAATFLANREGVVDVSTQAPITGTYTTIDPMGLIWSMMPPVPGPDYPSFAKGESATYEITVTAEIAGDLIETASLTRIFLPQDVHQTVVSEKGLVGYFFLPQTEEPMPALLIVGGSGGGVNPTMAAALASHGYATLALAYFGSPSLPSDLSEIPLEYFKTAFEWLQAQGAVDETKLGVIGTSRGGELALLLGATYPEVKAVIGYVASGVVWGNYSRTSVNRKAAWTYGGTPVPFASSALYLREATIPVERIQGPILLVSGEDDQIWPSVEYSEIAIARLHQFNHPYAYAHLRYEDAGHMIGVPYWPTTGTVFTHPVSGVRFTAGGTPEGNASASADAWVHVLVFLERAFQADES